MALVVRIPPPLLVAVAAVRLPSTSGGRATRTARRVRREGAALSDSPRSPRRMAILSKHTGTEMLIRSEVAEDFRVLGGPRVVGVR